MTRIEDISAGWPAFRLDGRTAVLGILGDPVAQVKAPAPLTALLQGQRGLNAVLVPLHVRADDVAQLLPALSALRNVAGFIVTVPHKQHIASLLGDALLPAARRAGAANVVRRTPQGWQADLLDGAGFTAGLREAGFDPRGRSARIVGAGGAASAIAFALADAGVRELRVCDVDAVRAGALVAQLKSHGIDAAPWDGADTRGADLLVNATPMGMRDDDPLPVPLDALRPGLWVTDVIMAPAVTPLLAAARAQGCRTHEGRHMMEQQLALMADFFTRAIAVIALDRLEVRP